MDKKKFSEYHIGDKILWKEEEWVVRPSTDPSGKERFGKGNTLANVENPNRTFQPSPDTEFYPVIPVDD